ncbi:MAG: spondin domain-containing protein [Pseudobdellovibrionaceae bacterium]|nr:spondin domain-containing protein [Pseudobdellovibrionaceae bacterium]
MSPKISHSTLAVLGIFLILPTLGCVGESKGASRKPSLGSAPPAVDAQTTPLKIRVTVQNSTGDNALSPFIVALHSPEQTLFQLGMPASTGLARVAETGDTSVLEPELDMLNIMHVKAPGDPIPAGATRSAEFTIDPVALQGTRLSLVSMIGRSNDSFVALEGIELSQVKMGRLVLDARNYDAGSEENTGNVGDFGPGGHPTTHAENLVSVDRGLNLRGDAPENWGWGETAARVTIELVP